ncbi:MAG: potassium channel family protein [Betaproteobacteria bacterium]|nr:potassium channel family protein [Betaproteobacteria bacterium]MDH5221122.1 potassium channel family protein [Betaproteobacteria bacterium]MDH5350258.1 potassium channel family protein [Betaproteobacteria bacterium]
MDSRMMRRNFATALLDGLRVVWPVLSFLVGLMVTLGLVVGLREGWSIQESIYFAFVSGLTIGYGDLAPKTLLARTLAILIGVCGVLFTALLAAIAVKALTAASGDGADRSLGNRMKGEHDS